MHPWLNSLFASEHSLAGSHYVFNYTAPLFYVNVLHDDATSTTSDNMANQYPRNWILVRNLYMRHSRHLTSYNAYAKKL